MNKLRVGNQAGMALVIALLMLLALTLTGISAISSSIFESNIAGNERVGAAAFYAAEAVLQVAIYQLPSMTAVARTSIGSDAYGWTGAVTDKSSPLESKYHGWHKRPRFGTEWSFKRFQVHATGEAFTGTKEVEAGVSYGPISTGSGHNN